MEAPIFGIPTINLGNRQNKRSKSKNIHNVEFNEKKILNLINYFFKKKYRYLKQKEFGKGNSFKLFEKALTSKDFWKIGVQKTFKDKL